ncbi:pyridoxine/pyridoxamine 5'-phosphate oxidase [Flavobacteriaceae bacterium MAR_2009_75]|nr:pyridoxine/pyridoxamine 5'-phosphate oxidase [Flavobacteriaceae bacterium MAR_2009_75]
MIDKIWGELKEELILGVTQKGHPFRFCTFTSVDSENSPQMRTVVLRHISTELNPIFYTDKRSKKIFEIEKNNKVSLLFYNPEKLLQIKIEGRASILNNPQRIEDLWAEVPENNKKDYTTDLAPGTFIDNPDKVAYLADKNYFCPVEIEPHKIEYLKLKRPNHIRVSFLKENGSWKGKFMVP